MTWILPLSHDRRATMRFGVVILAAGASRRLGRPKVLVKRVGQSLVRHQVRRAQAAGASWIGVAIGPNGARMHEALRGLPIRLIKVHHWRQGMGSSLALAVRTAPLGLRLVIVAADQWALEASDFSALVRAPARRIRAAVYDDVVGIPAVFPPLARRALIRLHGDRGARGLLSRADRHSLPGAERDLDTPDDLRRLNTVWPIYRRCPR